jgi:predicted DCC family thiol-disulfide oxidoreductase YuxK
MSDTAGAPGRPVLVFDGDCGFCTSCAEWVERHLSDGAQVSPWQMLGDDGLTALGLSVDLARQKAWWVDEKGRTFGGHLAIGMALVACRPPWRWLGKVALVPPGVWIGRVVYPFVSRYRFMLPGATPACRVRR